MPAELDACIAQLKGEPGVDNPHALCQWMKANGKGMFAEKPGDLFAVQESIREFREGPRLQPPLGMVRIVPGHTEQQALLNRSGMPAFGWLENLYQDGTKVKGDFGGVSKLAEDLIRNGHYRMGSAEVYKGFQAGGQYFGDVLRRFSVLGEDVPEIKTLQELPLPADGELKGVELFDVSEHPEYNAGEIVRNFHLLNKPTGAASFAESATPAVILTERRSTMKTVKRSKFKGFSPKAKLTLRKFQEEDMPVEDLEAMPEEAAAPPAGVTLEEMTALLSEWGFTEEELAGMNEVAMAAIIRVYKNRMAQAETPPAPAPEPTPLPTMAAAELPRTQAVPPPAPAAPSLPGVPSQTPSQVTLKFDEVSHRLGLIEKQQQTAAKFAEDNLAAEKKAKIARELDQLVSDGKVLPATRAGHESILRSLDCITLTRFSEGNKEFTVTPFDHYLNTLKAGPKLIQYSESVHQPGTQQTGMDPAAKRAALAATPLGQAALRRMDKARAS